MGACSFKSTIKNQKHSNLRRIITGKDALYLLETLHKLNLENSLVSLIERMKDLNKIVPYEKAVSVLAKTGIDGVINSYKIINISYPQNWLELYQEKKYEIVDPVIKKNFCTYDLFHWKDLKKKNGKDKIFWKLADDFNLTQGCTYGLPNRFKTVGSLFSFTGASLDHPRNEAILRIVTPQLDIKLREIFAEQQQPNTRLSDREIEVLQWVKEGKSNWDISAILSISERTVKFHITSILKKLNVVNRSQAVAVAISQNIIEL